ncbi:MAG: CPBP family intramembrane metalloprotease [Alphaproteobacteria bacterium]|nr:CPBP family intramembrane metalloprotease [Alphaproteobacteria bacterium]
MTRGLMWSILGIFLAVTITSTMDATGLLAFSALPLFPLIVLFWFLQRFSRIETGFVWGVARPYLLAMLYPLLVIGILLLTAAMSGAIGTAHTDWRKAGLNLALVSVSTVLVAIITEEGFFRGWLWASLRRTGMQPIWVLVASSLAFSLWHWSAVVFDTGFNPSPTQIPVFMVNAAVMGAIWGFLRWISGSVIVSSVSHGFWNGMAYVLFGFGKKAGALGVANTALFGPEIGILGLALNAAFAVVLFLWWRRAQAVEMASPNVASEPHHTRGRLASPVS